MLLETIGDSIVSRPIMTVLLAVIFSLLLWNLYRIFLHPLARVPGPLLAKCTSLWQLYHSFVGDECTAVHFYHHKYGKVVRVAPNVVDIADGSALAPIYTDKGGFRKADCYANFDLDGFVTIFSARDPSQRAARAKAVAQLFSNASIRAQRDLICECVARFVAGIKKDKERSPSQPVDIQAHSRFLALDVVSSYLFGSRFQSSPDSSEKLSASPWVDAIVGFGRLFSSPAALLDLYLRTHDVVSGVQELEGKSSALVHDFSAGLVTEPIKDDSFQARMKSVGISNDEIMAQCKDVIFAGTDSTGMVVTTILWYLCKNPKIYSNLRAEILANPNPPDLQQLPYLRGVIREGLRLSNTNPTRLPRVVPSSGWAFDNTFFPAGTIVGVAAFELHSNPQVFKHPDAFLPERWLEPSPEMNRDWIPFGTGARQCIARNLATAELFIAVQKVAEADLLSGGSAVREEIEIKEWFNAQVKGGKVEIEFGLID